jgi:hypothetical protein
MLLCRHIDSKLSVIQDEYKKLIIAYIVRCGDVVKVYNSQKILIGFGEDRQDTYEDIEKFVIGGHIFQWMNIGV